MTSPIVTVCRKELIENSRDRRTIVSTLLLGPLLVPALWAFLINVMVSQTVSDAETSISVPIAGQEYAPNLVAYLSQHGIEATDNIGTLAAATNAVREGSHDFALVIESDFPDAFRAGQDARVTLVFDQSRAQANAGTRRLQMLLNRYAAELRLMRLQARGVSPLVLRPFTVDEFDVSTATGRSVLVLGVLSYFLLLATLMGGFYLAIDSTAGERERGSLEPLLTVPATRTQLLLGKMAATVGYMMLSLALTVAGLSVALRFAPLEELGMRSNFGPLVALQIILIVAPFAPLGAAPTIAGHIPENWRFGDQSLGELSGLVAVVIQDTERFRGADCIAVQVGKHLLTTLQAEIKKEHNGDAFIPKLRLLAKRQVDCGPSVLSIIDDETGRHRNTQHTDTAAIPIVSHLIEADFAIDRYGDR